VRAAQSLGATGGKKRKAAPPSPVSQSEVQEEIEIEERFLTSKMDTHFCLLFNDAPIWLLSLDRSFAASVVLFGVVSARELSDRLDGTLFSPRLLLAVIARLEPRCVSYTKDPAKVSHDAVWLISGGLATIDTLINQVPTSARSLCLVNHHLRGSPRLSDFYCWQTVKHLHFGGATVFRTVLGCRHLDLRPVKTTLCRTLVHVIDFAKPAYGPQQDLPHNLADRLNPDFIGRAVTYRTLRSTTGWGCRSLTIGELGVAFGLPSCFRPAVETSQFFRFVPLQILDGIPEALVSTQTPTSAHIPKIKRVTIPIPAHRTWLPTLGLYHLPHDWIDLTAVTNVAAKSDDAAVVVSMWNRRISSVLTCADDDLDTWRTLLHRRKSLAMSREFRRYLATRHGPAWCPRVDALRAAGPQLRGGGEQKKKQKN
jgi:hypothetical protein